MVGRLFLSLVYFSWPYSPRTLKDNSQAFSDGLTFSDSSTRLRVITAVWVIVSNARGVVSRYWRRIGLIRWVNLWSRSPAADNPYFFASALTESTSQIRFLSIESRS